MQNFIITDAGRQAVVNAQNSGTNAITISQIALGSGTVALTKTSTSLTSEVKRIPANGGAAAAADTIHVTGSDASSSAYVVNEVGVYTSTGVLFAVYSSTTGPIITKAGSTVALIAIDLTITGIPVNFINVGNAQFSYPAATILLSGVLKVSRKEDVDLGTSVDRALTPSNLEDVFMLFQKRQYPVGEIFVTRQQGNPSQILGFGSWQRYGEGRMLISLQEGNPYFGQVDSAGGQNAIRLTVGQLPSHLHTVSPQNVTTSFSGDHSHSIPIAAVNSDYGTRIASGPGAARGAIQSGQSGNHSHSVNIPTFYSGSTGNGDLIGVMNPYIVVNMWVRTA
jgi:microcystin-dependent protein